MAGDLVDVAPNHKKLVVGLVKRGGFVVAERGVLMDVLLDDFACGIVDAAVIVLRHLGEILLIAFRQP